MFKVDIFLPSFDESAYKKTVKSLESSRCINKIFSIKSGNYKTTDQNTLSTENLSSSKFIKVRRSSLVSL